jgi:hypothetical protein
MKYKDPKSYKNDKESTTVSVRIELSKKEVLEKAAKNADMSLSELLRGILESYAEWLIHGGKK